MAEFSMILANNNRSKAYLQTLCAHGILPARVLLLREGGRRLPEQTAHDKIPQGRPSGKFIRRHPETGIAFDEKESLESTLERHGIAAEALDTLDMNSSPVAERLRALPGEFVVYSGPGGVLLKPSVLAQGKKLIHVHPGRLPDFKGSTTVYYSYLLERRASASAIFMEADLDAGPVLLSMDFDLGPGEQDIDYLVDPAVRTRVLLECMRDLDRLAAAARPQRGDGRTFFIIHPVLRHLALAQPGGKGSEHG